MKRFNLVIPDETYNSLEEVAQMHKTSKTAIVKKYIKLGLKLEKQKVEFVYRASNGEMKKVMFS